MTRLTITIEDCDVGVIIVGDPSLQALQAKASAQQSLTVGEMLALAAWAAIAESALDFATATDGTFDAGELH